jgi:hypothetical protein
VVGFVFLKGYDWEAKHSLNEPHKRIHLNEAFGEVFTDLNVLVVELNLSNGGVGKFISDMEGQVAAAQQIKNDTAEISNMLKSDVNADRLAAEAAAGLAVATKGEIEKTAEYTATVIQGYRDEAYGHAQVALNAKTESLANKTDTYAALASCRTVLTSVENLSTNAATEAGAVLTQIQNEKNDFDDTVTSASNTVSTAVSDVQHAESNIAGMVGTAEQKEINLRSIASAIGPVQFFDTKAKADIGTWSDGDLIEILEDEERGGRRSRYRLLRKSWYMPLT